jgi:DNA-binding phage protein
MLLSFPKSFKQYMIFLLGKKARIKGKHQVKEETGVTRRAMNKDDKHTNSVNNII